MKKKKKKKKTEMSDLLRDWIWNLVHYKTSVHFV